MDTALLPQHQQLAAKLVDFSGWNMPLHYGSQVEEHHHVRQHAGLFDVSHMGIVQLTGSDATAFLQRLCANDISKASNGQAQYTCMLNPAGGVIDDLIVYKHNDQHYTLVINAGRRHEDITWLQTHLAQYQHLQLHQPSNRGIIAIQGPRARSLCADFLGQEILNLKPFRFLEQSNVIMARTGYTGEDGLELIAPTEQITSLWQQCVNAGIHPCGLGARDTLRLEAGLNLYGNDMDENTSPVAANLSWTVDLNNTQRDFIGKAAYLDAQKIITERLIGVTMQDRGVLRAQQPILSEHGQCGIITSGGFSPTLGHAIGLARISQDAMHSALYIERRGQRIALQTVAPPFVKKGKKTTKEKHHASNH